MSQQLTETGWQRFLDRLKQLWGKSGRADLPAAAADAAHAHGASIPRALDEKPAPDAADPAL